MASQNNQSYPLNLLGMGLDEIVNFLSMNHDEAGKIYFFDKLSISYHRQGLEFIFNQNHRVETIHVFVSYDKNMEKFIFRDKLSFFNSVQEIRNFLGEPKSIRSESEVPILGLAPKVEHYQFHNIDVMLTYQLGSNNDLQLITFCNLQRHPRSNLI